MVVLLEIFDKNKSWTNIDIGIKVYTLVNFKTILQEKPFFSTQESVNCISLNLRNISLSMFSFDNSVP